MLTLAEIKNNVAVSKGYPSWKEMEGWYIDSKLSSNMAVLLSTAWNEVAKKYATAACEEQRLNCYDAHMSRESTEVDADHILNAPLPTLK